MPISGACLPVREPTVRVESDADAAVTLMTVLGAWGTALAQQAALALHKCLGDHPEALIVDLSALADPRTESAATWIGAQRAAARLDPPLQLALCVPPGEPLAARLLRLVSREHLPLYARVRQARVAIAGRLPDGDRMSVTIAPQPEAPSIARNLVGDACRQWGLVELLHPARAVMSELVTNAVEHARTELTVVVTRRGSGLQVAVSDGVAEHPRLIRQRRPRRDEPLDERGRGLRMVAETATAWGSLPTPLGKVVWATLQPAHEEQPAAVPRRRHPNAAAPHR
jgi:anti-sigma regulatory factor (Ser/Thr protein kinase)